MNSNDQGVVLDRLQIGRAELVGHRQVRSWREGHRAFERRYGISGAAETHQAHAEVVVDPRRRWLALGRFCEQGRGLGESLLAHTLLTFLDERKRVLRKRCQEEEGEQERRA